jgi:hypothetical protein
MKANIVDLRYHMKDVLKALERNEEVHVLYHGTVKGTIVTKNNSLAIPITEHPFFNMYAGKGSVSDEMERLREGRYRDL